jgi:hypothetical protein
MKRSNAFFAVAVSVFALTGLTLTGCSDRTEQAASNTVDAAAQDAANHTAAAGQAVEKTGEAVAEGTKEAVDATGKAVEQTGEAVATGAAKTGEAVQKGAEYTGEAVGGAVKGVGKEAEDIAQIAKMTPLVKDALIRSKLDAKTIDVDTSGEKDTVILRGTVKSEAQKKTAMQSAMAAVKGSGESFKVKSELTVAP